MWRRRHEITAEDAAANRRHARKQIRKLNGQTLASLEELALAVERAVALYPAAVRPVIKANTDFVDIEDIGNGPQTVDLLRDGVDGLRNLADAVRSHQHRARQVAQEALLALDREESDHLDGG